MGDGVRSEGGGGSGPPLVSIGLPVYNGEKYLSEAIDSILGQTYRNLELIICDNASTDRTEEICRAYAARDPRVRYYRNERNLGAAPNYNLCFARARGKYFKWSAHDDRITPDFVAKAVAKLESNANAVLCCLGYAEVGPGEAVERTFAAFRPRIEHPRPSERFAEMIITPHGCEDFFGVFRREVLAGSGLHGNYISSDRVLLAEMALRGPFTQVTEPLFLHRNHGGRFTTGDFSKRKWAAQWLDTSRKGGRRCDFWVAYLHYWRAVRKNVNDRRERLACYGHLLRWCLDKYNSRDLINDLLWWIHPALFSAVCRVKRALFGERERLYLGASRSGEDRGKHAPIEI